MINKLKKVVTMGGGTGTFPVVTALKSLNARVVAIVSVSDSGGSTGRIRDEFGFQPVGDLRQSLAALADPVGQAWIQKLLLYRFEKGNGLVGHNLGNLILTALQDMTGSTSKSLKITEKIFNLSGAVVPITDSKVNLKIIYEDGSSEVGEHVLDNNSKNPKKIKKVELTPDCQISSLAKENLLEADFIVIGPGDLYASIMSTLVANGTKEVFKNSKAKIIYVSNLMTRRTQTHTMTASQHLEAIENAIGKKVDYIIVNNEPITKQVINHYAKEQEHPVNDDFGSDNRVIRTGLIATDLIKKSKHDTAHRSLLRHDPKKLKSVLQNILS
jgi:uncharacterized cofD-like protein